MSDEDVVRERIRLLDGLTRFAFSLWRLPLNVRFDDVDLDVWPQEYIQCAGSQAQMTIEVRQSVDHGYEHLVLGHSSGSSGGEVAIQHGERTTRVRGSEVFTGNEVADIFVSYLRDDQVPSALSVRPIDRA